MTYFKNPVDTGRPSPDFVDIARHALDDAQIDAAIVFALHEPPAIDPVKVMAALRDNCPKPVVFGTAGARTLIGATLDAVQAIGVPAVDSPDAAARIMRALVEDAKAQYRLSNYTPNKNGLAPEQLSHLSADNIDEDQAKTAMEKIGIPCPKRVVASDHESAIKGLADIGGPVVLKVLDPSITHKTEVGGVHLNINSEQMLREALSNIDAIPSGDNKRYLLEAMAPSGLEMIIGGVNDDSFGSVVMLGLGGTTAEAISDTAIRLAPIGKNDALAMIGELKGSALLHGWRGSSPLDTEALADALIALGDLLLSQPDVAEIDINPLRVYEQGILALDTLIVKRQVGS